MGRFGSFMTWYRLKSDPDNLYLKMDAAKFIDEQPRSIEDADAFSKETIEGTKEMHEILATDNRLLVAKLDLRNFDCTQINPLPVIRYVTTAANQGMEISRLEVIGAGSYWPYFASFLPKKTRDKIVLK